MTASLLPPATLPLDRETVERLAAQGAEPDWLRDARLAAAARFSPDAWPTGQEEEWRRFPLAGLPQGALAGAASATAYEGASGGALLG
ncbi:MAG: hypothetical protein ACRDF0_10855, partial [Candidatus Limnocylindria bacterium]